MKKIIATLLLLIIIALSVTTLIMGTRWQSAVRTYQDGAHVGTFALESAKGDIAIADGLRFRIETGSPVSTISHEQLQWLESHGYDVDSTYTFLLSKKKLGMALDTRGYRVSLPFYGGEVESDSLGISYVNVDYSLEPVVIDNVDFLPVQDGEEPCLGVDFLQNFMVEYRVNPRSVSLTTYLPDNYQELGDIDQHTRLVDMLAVTNPYYLTIDVDNRINEYMIDTSLGDMQMKLPADDSVVMRRRKRHIEINNVNGLRRAAVDYRVWVQFGNRAGSCEGYFYNDLGSDYALNPFSFFTQDVVLDFKNGKLYLHPFYSRHDHTNLADIND